jgi:protein LTV1
VNRSQQDPLVADETAPQHVLVPIRKNKAEEASTSRDSSLPPEKRRKEQQKFGIYFDDDYDYLQHLKEPGRAPELYWEEVPHKHADEAAKPKIQLPSSVFASEFEEKEGLLRKAAPRSGPRLDWDPDIVEALDDDFDFEDPDNELDDDFMDQAMGGDEDEDDEWLDEEESSDVDSNAAGYSDEEDDDIGPLPRNFAKFDGDDENKSRFTEYSMSSSVIRRNDQLTLLDDRFEKFYEDYDDPEVGALDCEEIEGHVDIDNELLLECAQEFKKKELPQKYDKAWDVCRLVKMQHVEDAPEEIVALEVSDDEDVDGKKKKKWDCESILSTYSNIYNHPKVIDVPSKRQAKIQINMKTGLPMNVLEGDEKGKLTRKALAKLATEEQKSNSGPKSLCAESVLSTLSVLSIRPKDETPEERRERKKLLKEYKQERRIEKKLNKIAFNEERLRQHTIEMNNKNNMQGNKIV